MRSIQLDREVPSDHDVVMHSGRHANLFSTGAGSVASVSATRRPPLDLR